MVLLILLADLTPHRSVIHRGAHPRQPASHTTVQVFNKGPNPFEGYTFGRRSGASDQQRSVDTAIVGNGRAISPNPNYGSLSEPFRRTSGILQPQLSHQSMYANRRVTIEPSVRNPSSPAVTEDHHLKTLRVGNRDERTTVRGVRSNRSQSWQGYTTEKQDSNFKDSAPRGSSYYKKILYSTNRRTSVHPALDKKVQNFQRDDQAGSAARSTKGQIHKDDRQQPWPRLYQIAGYPLPPNLPDPPDVPNIPNQLLESFPPRRFSLPSQKSLPLHQTLSELRAVQETQSCPMHRRFSEQPSRSVHFSSLEPLHKPPRDHTHLISSSKLNSRPSTRRSESITSLPRYRDLQTQSNAKSKQPQKSQRPLLDNGFRVEANIRRKPSSQIQSHYQTTSKDRDSISYPKPSKRIFPARRRAPTKPHSLSRDEATSTFQKVLNEPVSSKNLDAGWDKSRQSGSANHSTIRALSDRQFSREQKPFMDYAANGRRHSVNLPDSSKLSLLHKAKGPVTDLVKETLAPALINRSIDSIKHRINPNESNSFSQPGTYVIPASADPGHSQWLNGTAREPAIRRLSHQAGFQSAYQSPDDNMKMHETYEQRRPSFNPQIFAYGEGPRHATWYTSNSKTENLGRYGQGSHRIQPARLYRLRRVRGRREVDSQSDLEQEVANSDDGSNKSNEATDRSSENRSDNSSEGSSDESRQVSSSESSDESTDRSSSSEPNNRSSDESSESLSNDSSTKSVWGRVGSRLMSAASRHGARRAGSQLGGQIGKSVGSRAGDGVGNRKWSRARNRAASRAGARAIGQVGKHLGGRVVKGLWNQVTSRDDDELEDGVMDGLGGLWDSFDFDF